MKEYNYKFYEQVPPQDSQNTEAVFIWDIFIDKLCDWHTARQHDDIHRVYSILTSGAEVVDPAILRWSGDLTTLSILHDNTDLNLCVWELKTKYCPLDLSLSSNNISFQKPVHWWTLSEQEAHLRAQDCDCFE